MFTIKGKTGEWELVIGLETHIEVLSNSKLFSSTSANYNPSILPNTQVSFVDFAMPGMLPVLNEFCIEQAIRMGIGLNAKISNKSIFARKQYFYPDLPSGYQISQPPKEDPIVGRGYVEITDDEGNPKKIFIERAHLEQDAGKLKHDANPTKSYADYNRTGVALLEIVTFLDTTPNAENSYISSPDEAEKYLREIREIARALKVSKANMEEGSMRADVNVSVRPKGSKEFRTRTETKNMVSFKFIKNAIEYEAKRQIEIYENGGTVSQDTMRYNQNDGTTSVMRSKEDALDYRYFPDPDLPPLIVTDEQIEKIRKSMPELPSETRERYIKDFGLSSYDAYRLTENLDITNWFNKAINNNKSYAKMIANWMITELFAHPDNFILGDGEYDLNNDIRIIEPKDLYDLVDLIQTNQINGKQAKDIFLKMLEGEKGTVKEIAEKFDMKQITNESEIEAIINSVIESNPNQVEQYKSGKLGLFGYFVGSVMKATNGKANPELVNSILKSKLS